MTLLPAAWRRTSVGNSRCESYYRLHLHIYDATMDFFGRLAILREALVVARPVRILEVGCGTGKTWSTLPPLFRRRR